MDRLSTGEKIAGGVGRPSLHLHVLRLVQRRSSRAATVFFSLSVGGSAWKRFSYTISLFLMIDGGPPARRRRLPAHRGPLRAALLAERGGGDPRRRRRAADPLPDRRPAAGHLTHPRRRHQPLDRDLPRPDRHRRHHLRRLSGDAGRRDHLRRPRRQPLQTAAPAVRPGHPRRAAAPAVYATAPAASSAELRPGWSRRPSSDTP